MPKGKKLTDEQRMEIYEAARLGESNKDIAEAYGIAPDSVRYVVRRQRELLEQKEDDMAHRECIVAGNKRTGRLVSTADPHRYEGTCVVSGKAHSKTFTTDNAAAATDLWSDWCNELRNKQQRPTAPAHDEPVVKPKMAVPPKQPATESKEVKPLDTNSNISKPKSVYVIWVKGDSPRLFGAYTSMDSAIGEVDRLNDVASFLGNDRIFEVEELALRS